MDGWYRFPIYNKLFTERSSKIFKDLRCNTAALCTRKMEPLINENVESVTTDQSQFVKHFSFSFLNHSYKKMNIYCWLINVYSRIYEKELNCLFDFLFHNNLIWAKCHFMTVAWGWSHIISVGNANLLILITGTTK